MELRIEECKIEEEECNYATNYIIRFVQRFSQRQVPVASIPTLQEEQLHFLLHGEADVLFCLVLKYVIRRLEKHYRLFLFF